MYKIALTITLVLCLFTVACAPIEQTARNGIATAKGFLDSEKAAHPECVVNAASSNACYLISKGVAAKDSTIDALEAYCGGPEFDNGGACTPHADLQPKLKSVLANLNQTIADIKKAVK